MKIKIIAPLMAYVTIAIGLFWARSAWAALLGFHAAILSSLFLAKPNTPLSLLFKTHSINWSILSILLCGSSGVSLYFLWSYFGVAEDFSAQLNSIGLTISTWPAFIAYFVLVNPFVEEYFWRGFLGSLSRSISIYDAIFAGYHVLLLIGKAHYASIVLVFALLTLASWFWRQITDRDGGLLAPVLGHMAADLTILLTVSWMSSYR
jgi:membrane protease YdiL (CAAX protease family)